MAKHKYITNRTLFDDDESIPNTSLDHRTARYQKLNDQILKHQEDVLRKTLEVSNHTLAILQQTTDIGIETAKELHTQGEKLRNANVNLDKMKADLEVSQKNINGMKSFYKRIKCYFKGRSKDLVRNVKRTPEISDKPSLLPTILTESCQIPIVSKGNEIEHQSLNLTGVNKDLNDVINSNTEEIYNALPKLKEIAIAIGKEIEDQDKVLDEIHEKVERADIKIGSQTDQMTKLLRK